MKPAVLLLLASAVLVPVVADAFVPIPDGLRLEPGDEGQQMLCGSLADWNRGYDRMGFLPLASGAYEWGGRWALFVHLEHSRWAMLDSPGALPVAWDAGYCLIDKGEDLAIGVGRMLGYVP